MIRIMALLERFSQVRIAFQPPVSLPPEHGLLDRRPKYFSGAIPESRKEETS